MYKEGVVYCCVCLLYYSHGTSYHHFLFIFMYGGIDFEDFSQNPADLPWLPFLWLLFVKLFRKSVNLLALDGHQCVENDFPFFCTVDLSVAKILFTANMWLGTERELRSQFWTWIIFYNIGDSFSGKIFLSWLLLKIRILILKPVKSNNSYNFNLWITRKLNDFFSWIFFQEKNLLLECTWW